MPDHNRTFVGFGFGAIQAGLFLNEAYKGGNFDRLVVAEVIPEAVSAVRKNDGFYWLNTAHFDRIEQTRIGPIEIADPSIAADCELLIDAMVQAEEIATAVPSIKFYATDQAGSIHRLLATGLRKKVLQNGPRAVIYTAENHNRAAENLQAAVLDEIPANEQVDILEKVRFLNTVIGKMSAVVTDPAQIEEQNLATITPQLPRAFRVEAFNRILISAIDFEDPPFQRGITVFTEKSNLMPFEEAKLYGHNATHALGAYIGQILGVQFISELYEHPGMMNFLRRAFIDESGAALIRKYDGVDPLFTSAGYTAYAEDLLVRMTNPLLRDDVERVGRDPKRKLGWHDRLIGTIRLALTQGIQPQRYAMGAAAALVQLDPAILVQPVPTEAILNPIWQDTISGPEERVSVLSQINQAAEILRHWKTAGYPKLENFIQHTN